LATIIGDDLREALLLDEHSARLPLGQVDDHAHARERGDVDHEIARRGVLRVRRVLGITGHGTFFLVPSSRSRLGCTGYVRYGGVLRKTLAKGGTNSARSRSCSATKT
jgi:hypothetical protein